MVVRSYRGNLFLRFLRFFARQLAYSKLENKLILCSDCFLPPFVPISFFLRCETTFILQGKNGEKKTKCTLQPE